MIFVCRVRRRGGPEGRHNEEHAASGTEENSRALSTDRLKQRSLQPNSREVLGQRFSHSWSMLDAGGAGTHPGIREGKQDHCLLRAPLVAVRANIALGMGAIGHPVQRNSPRGLGRPLRRSSRAVATTGSMMNSIIVALLLAASTAPASPACKQASPGLRARAKISCAAARQAALRSIGGKHLRVVSAELEDENQRVVYSFDIARRGATGVDEIQIDATSGELVSHKHETAKAEAAEKD